VAQPGSLPIFLNVPFDRGYEPLFVTLVGTLVFFGQTPRCVLEIRESGQGRLSRLHQLLAACPVSIHDLSRVGSPVRFNMPFELGMACGLALSNGGHEHIVLDAKPYRLDKTLRARSTITTHFGTPIHPARLRCAKGYIQ